MPNYCQIINNAVQGIRACLHTLHFKKIKKMKREKIVCGPENVAAFNAELRQRIPGFYALAKQLHHAGLIDGLGGASVEPRDADTTFADDPRVPHSDQICRDCQHWQPDTVGDGTGLGHCHAGNIRLHWPKQNACRQFEEKL